jgi:hypothetical protein
MTTTNQRAVEELLPCPFCNSPAEYLGSEANGYEVGCSRCGAKAGWGDYGYQAAQKWNRRTPGWRPISEAPRDGTRIMIYSPLDGWVSSHYEGGCWQGLPWRPQSNPEYATAQPTAWMPLPPPPGEG